MNKFLKLFLILLASGIVITALYSWVVWDGEKKIKEITGGGEITSSELALTLLTKEDVETAANVPGSVLSELPQFNGVVEQDTYNSMDLVGKNFLGKQSAEEILENAISLYNTKEDAERFIESKAQEAGNTKTTRSFDDNILTLVLTSKGNGDTLPSSTMRFAVGTLVARITVYGNNSTIDYTDTGLLTTVALNLATRQREKIDQLLAGKLLDSVNLWKTNMALNNFPKTLSNAQLMGKVPFSDHEWLGETRDVKRDSIAGFASGASGRFKLADTPEQVLDIVIMEFKNKEDALKEQRLFFTEGIHLEDKTSKELSLPDSVKSFSVARTSDTIVELQAVKGIYFYDIAIVAPFAEEFDQEKAARNLIRYSEEVLQ